MMAMEVTDRGIPLLVVREPTSAGVVGIVVGRFGPGSYRRVDSDGSTQERQQ